MKFSHEVEFSATDEFSVFLSISNWTSSPLVLTIVPIQNEDPNCLKVGFLGWMMVFKGRLFSVLTQSLSR